MAHFRLMKVLLFLVDSLGLKKALKSQFLNVLFNLDDYANFTVSGKLQLNTFFKKAFCSNFVQLVCVFT